MTESPADLETQIQILQRGTRQMPEGPARVAVYQEMVRLQDLTGDLQKQYALRTQLIREGVFGGRKDLAIVAFSWCWAKAQELPEQFPPANLLWQYKWIIGAVWQFPRITNREIENHLNEMERAFREHGSTMQVVYNYRMDAAMYCGHLEQAAKYYELYRGTQRDSWSDCQACERNGLLEYFSLLGDDQRVMDKAKDLLNGRYSCATIPTLTYNKVLIPLLRLGEPERALAMHEKGYNKIKRRSDYAANTAQHLLLLALTGNWDDGLKILKKHFADGWNQPIPWRRMQYLKGAAFFLQHYPGVQDKRRTMRVPPEMNLGGEKEKRALPLAEIAPAVSVEFHSLADSFDQRNGNTAQRDAWKRQADLWQYAVVMPLPSKTT